MGADVSIRQATPEDAAFLAEHLRPVEVEEVRAATGQEPLQAILAGLRDSAECWSLLFDNELAGIWGVVPASDGVGVAWLLTTDLVERRAKTFWRACLVLAPAVLKHWPLLINAIDARHTKALRWAKRLGFKLEAPEPFGVAGMPFCRFSVTKEDLCAPYQH